MQETIQSSLPIERWIAHLSPQVGQWLLPTFSTIDSARTWLAQYIDQGLTWTQTQSTSRTVPTVLPGVQPFVDGVHATAIIATSFLVYVLRIGRSVIVTVEVFYAVAALIILFILWRLFFRRDYPRY
jgi:hypothetical protein